MIEQILRVLHAGNVTSVSELARLLAVDESLVEAMLDDLLRRGYLSRSSASCTQACSGCPSAGSCAATGPTALWTLTDMGRKSTHQGGL